MSLGMTYGLPERIAPLVPCVEESETMKQIEGSTDGIKWIPYAVKADELEARQAAVSCILNTKHTYVRIIEVTA
jgi:hypothetical protein